MTNGDIEKFLAGHDFFKGLEDEDIRFLAGKAQMRQLDKEEVLFRYDAPASRFFLLARGRISLEVAAIEGPPLELQELGDGAILGWSWLIAPYRWSFQARAEVPSEVIEFDGKAILERCERNPSFGYELLKRFSSLMSERLEFARRRMMDEWYPPGFA